MHYQAIDKETLNALKQMADHVGSWDYIRYKTNTYYAIYILVGQYYYYPEYVQSIAEE